MKSEKINMIFSISGGQFLSRWVSGGQRIKGKKKPVTMFSVQKRVT